MPDLNDLQNEYNELTRTIQRQNELRESGSDDYDFDVLDRAFNRRNQVGRAIEEAGGTPGGEPRRESPPGGQDGSTGTPPGDPAPPDPDSSTIAQLESQIEQLRTNPPHPGVRLEGGKVIGGTVEDFKEQVEWRGHVERLEHELTAAQADEAWAQNGGADGFTDAEIGAIERASDKIDGIQTRLDGVNGQIAELEAQLEAARGQLDSQTTQGGGPNAASAAAIAVGARINADLRPLYQQQAAIMQELAAALGALSAIIRTRVRSQLDASDIEVDLPSDRTGKAAVEDAFLRRVYRRLGLPYRSTGASGILEGLTGGQSALPTQRTGLLVVASVVALLIFMFLAFTVLSGDQDTVPVVVAPDPTVAIVTEETVVSIVESPTVSTGVADTDTDVVVADAERGPLPMATAIGIPYGCATVVHSPLDGFPRSLSYFGLILLVGGLDGPIPDGTVLTVDAGGIASSSAPVIGYMADVLIPIDRFGMYSIESVTAEGPGGPLPVATVVDDVNVGGSEGPIGGCVPPSEDLDRNPDRLFPGSDARLSRNLWLGDDPPAPISPVDPPLDNLTPRFGVFLDRLDNAHETGDVSALFVSLDAAALDRYGSGQCLLYLEEVVGSFADPTLLDVTAEPWEYTTDGVTTSIEDAWTMQIDVTLGGDEVQAAMHVRPVGDNVFWFTDCGEPAV